VPNAITRPSVFLFFKYLNVKKINNGRAKNKRFFSITVALDFFVLLFLVSQLYLGLGVKVKIILVVIVLTQTF
jgi:hypothetical protein